MVSLLAQISQLDCRNDEKIVVVIPVGERKINEDLAFISELEELLNKHGYEAYVKCKR